MKIKIIPLALSAGILLFALPSGLRAEDGATPAATPAPTGHHGGCGHHKHHKHHWNGGQKPNQ